MTARNDEKPLPVTLAIIRDGRRRGGWRVCRVRVTFAPDGMPGAEVEEIGALRHVAHWLPFARLSKRPRPLGRKLRALLSDAGRGVAIPAPPPGEISAAPEEAQSAAVETLAGTAGAVEAPPPWWQRD